MDGRAVSTVADGPGAHQVRSTVGVRSRVLALVVVPLVGLLALSSSVAWSLRTRADQAVAVEAVVSRVARAVDAETAMRRETQAREFVLHLQIASLPVDVVAPALGIDPTQLAPAAAATDLALDALGTDGATIDRGQLTAVRDATAKDPAHAEELLEQTETLLSQFRAVTGGLLDVLRGAGAPVTGSAALDDAKSDVQLMRQMADVNNATIVAGERYLLVPTDTSRSWQRLVGAGANVQMTSDRLDVLLAVPAIVAGFRQLNDNPDGRMVKGAFSDMATSAAGTDNQPGAGPRGMTAELPRAAFAYQDGLYRLLASATTAVRDAAQAIGDDARAELNRWIGFAAAVTATTVILSLWCARSILRPLRRLASNADAIGRGVLAFDPGLRRVPREVAVTFGALGELTANLQVLEAKTQALAAGELDSPALAAPLPGALGRSLERSAEILSGSLTERDRLRAKLVHQASHDTLTGLHNRFAASEALQEALSRCGPDDRGVAVSVIDLDDFKRANDTYGHDLGDRVLCVQAARLVGVAGDAFTARLGADEFVVVHERVGDMLAITEVARRLTDALAEPIAIDGVTVAMSASVGIALAEDPTVGADQVLAWADLAMQRAKRVPGACVELYDEGLQEQLRRHIDTEHALQAAIRADAGLFLLFQPVLNVQTLRPVGVEALVRWDRPGHGIQPPDSFIPAAEASDLIIDLDRWVIGNALGQLADWSGHPDLRHLDMAVNVSGRHLLSRTLHRHVAEALARTGADPHRLVLEVTETLLLDNIELAAAELTAVRELGVRVAIDDFGTGYTSLAHLQRLPADIIKIDQSFIQRLHRGIDRTLTGMTTDIAHQLGATTVAEGIETDEQLDVVRELGCDEAQGYLFARPLPVPELITWIHDALEPTALAGSTRPR